MKKKPTTTATTNPNVATVDIFAELPAALTAQVKEYATNKTASKTQVSALEKEIQTLQTRIRETEATQKTFARNLGQRVIADGVDLDALIRERVQAGAQALAATGNYSEFFGFNGEFALQSKVKKLLGSNSYNGVFGCQTSRVHNIFKAFFDNDNFGVEGSSSKKVDPSTLPKYAIVGRYFHIGSGKFIAVAANGGITYPTVVNQRELNDSLTERGQMDVLKAAETFLEITLPQMSANAKVGFLVGNKSFSEAASS